MNKEELIKEIEEKEEYLNHLKYKHSILSMDSDMLLALIEIKDNKIKELQDKLETIKNVFDED